MSNQYRELLQKREWKIKRKVILKRDNYTCVNCQNAKLILNTIRFRYFGYAPTNNPNLIKLGIERNNIETICYIDKDYFRSYIKDKDNISLIISATTPNANQNSIISIIETSTDKAIFTFGLHVHHSYYQAEKQPWDYPDNSLTTLCWECHETLHKNQKVPFYNKDGIQVGELSPCLRCHGAGWFPEYNHVEGGICFRCEGERFEEHLIEKM